MFTVLSTAREGLIPSARILDQAGQVVESTVLANANGEIIIQAKGADPRRPHFVEVYAANNTGSHSTGTYDFVATFGTREVVLDRIATGTLKPDDPTRSTVLHVSETRLIHFVLAVDPVEGSTDSITWTVIYDGNGSPVFRAAARPGESRSANTLLLTPGDYEVEFNSTASDGTQPVELDYRLLSRSISLPIGPGPIDPTTLPILPCSNPASDPVYCYPDEVVVIDPFILPDPSSIIFPDPVALIMPRWLDPALWFWDGITPPADLPAPIGIAPPLNPVPPDPNPTPLPAPTPKPLPTPTPTIIGWRNPTSPHDVNGDALVSPIDVLLVINFLNRSGPQLLSNEHPTGSPFLDVNSDGFASPLDALMVINELNRTNGVAAEGEAAIGVDRPLAVSQTAFGSATPTSSPQQQGENAVTFSATAKPIRVTSIAPTGSATTAANRASVPSVTQRQPSLQTLEDAISQIATELTALRLFA